VAENAGSRHEVDMLHIAVWRECIDGSTPPLKFAHVVNLVPPSIAAAIAAREHMLTQGT
jgi:hypothetical protein